MRYLKIDVRQENNRGVTNDVIFVYAREKNEAKHFAFCFVYVCSPEHKVLKVSYCDHPVSVVCVPCFVRRVSCVVNIYVVHPL